jgi:hypothetical protein
LLFLLVEQLGAKIVAVVRHGVGLGALVIQKNILQALLLLMSLRLVLLVLLVVAQEEQRQ